MSLMNNNVRNVRHLNIVRGNSNMKAVLAKISAIDIRLKRLEDKTLGSIMGKDGGKAQSALRATRNFARGVSNANRNANIPRNANRNANIPGNSIKSDFLKLFDAVRKVRPGLNKKDLDHDVDKLYDKFNNWGNNRMNHTSTKTLKKLTFSPVPGIYTMLIDYTRYDIYSKNERTDEYELRLTA